jgi:hypothetical protein
VNHLRLSLHHSHSFSSLDKYVAAEKERIAGLNAGDDVAEDDLGVGDEEETPDLLSLDPKEWKVCQRFTFVSARIFNSFGVP